MNLCDVTCAPLASCRIQHWCILFADHEGPHLWPAWCNAFDAATAAAARKRDRPPQPLLPSPSPSPSLPPDLYTVREAAQLSGLSISTIRAYIGTGKIATYGRPGVYRVSLAELLPSRRKAYQPGQKPIPARFRPWVLARIARRDAKLTATGVGS